MLFSTRLAILLTATVMSFATDASQSVQQSLLINADEVSWGYLNPLRGENSPAAADLWGDRTKNVATGMLVKFDKGFSSPPHSHNVTYRGIVIEGYMHNDDPNANPMWLPSSSFWTQPAGENHITAANGKTNQICLEIDSGPYLVKASDQEYDNSERPINLHAANLVWLDQSESSLIGGTNVEISHLWKDNSNQQLQGYLLKLSADSKVEVSSAETEFKAVNIRGNIDYSSVETKHTVSLKPGSYIASSGRFSHSLRPIQQAVIYIRANGKFRAISQAYSQ